MSSRSPLIDDLLALREGACEGAMRRLGFVDEGGHERTLTYAELAQAALQTGGALRALGLRADQLLLLALPASIELASLLYGGVISGVLPCIAPAPGRRFGAENLQACEVICRLYRPSLVVAEDAAVPLLRERLGPIGLRIVGLRDVADAAAAALAPLIPPRGLDDAHHVQLTSGSISRPRAAVLSHRAVLDNSRGIGGRVGYDAARDATVSWLPLNHDMGLVTLLSNVHYRSRLQVMQPAAFIRNPLGWLKRVAAFEATTTAAPTFALRYCVRRYKPEAMDGTDLSCLRNLFIGAERVDERTVRDFAATFAAHGLHGTALQPCYGMAESVLAVSMHDASRTEPGPDLCHILADSAGGSSPGAAAPAAAPDTQLSVGHPIAGMQVCVRRPSGDLAAQGEAGEIFIRGSSVLQAYLPVPGESGGALLDREGWFATGDIGYQRGGHLYLLGRQKEIIILRGANYFPHEIEDAVSSHPAIHKEACAAVGVFDPQQGTERLVLLAESPPGRDPASDRAGVQLLLQRALGFNAHDIVFLPPGSLPRTTSGKLQRLKSRTLYLQGELASTVASAPELLAEAPPA